MFNQKKLTKEDLEELRKRVELINQHILISQALEMQKQIFVRNLLSKYRLDLNKNYKIDFKTGQIQEEKIKSQPQK